RAADGAGGAGASPAPFPAAAGGPPSADALLYFVTENLAARRALLCHFHAKQNWKDMICPAKLRATHVASGAELGAEQKLALFDTMRVFLSERLLDAPNER